MHRRSSKRSVKERWMSTSSTPSSDFCSNELEQIPCKTQSSLFACTKAWLITISLCNSYLLEPQPLSMNGWQKPCRLTEHTRDRISSLQALLHSRRKVTIDRSWKVSMGTLQTETRVWENQWISIAFLLKEKERETLLWLWKTGTLCKCSLWWNTPHCNTPRKQAA